ncbi:epoxide hydrolase family protein [Fodinicola acaciae]|uniref:epoxide hydrolase family protein n=1 Tax=Fodinicola acaciae TaxID=2681555 RepID=UPI001651D9C3|nr:epoxide hydrolase family protein [Fodinicola acaciae]
MDDNAVTPFRIEISDAAIQDLHDRLDRTRWPDELPDVGWSYGTPLAYLKELAAYWRNDFDWRAAEATLNAYDQFTTTIDGTNVHFLHVRSAEPTARPLLVTHGWPGSVAEFLRILGPLTDPAAHGGDPAEAFHVVAPSIPGYGFSGPTTETGWDLSRVGNAFVELMSRLGYERFGVHGGDWGAMISRSIGLGHTDRVTGVHLTMLPTGIQRTEPTEAELAGLSEADQARLKLSYERTKTFTSDGSAYGMLQSTRPQTLSYALTDSPVGQLSWIAEKFKAWTDSTDRPEDAIDRDQMLTNISIYWFTGTAGSSARLYYESAHAGTGFRGGPPPAGSVPTGVAVFPAELSVPIRQLAEKYDNIVHWAEYEHGGHFAAMEQPDVLVADLRTFFRKV